MVLRLAEALDLPKPATNQALGAAGFAPAYPSAAPGAPELDWARNALDRLLERHAPYPGVVMDRGWNVVAANAGAARLFGVGGLASEASNMAEALLTLGASDVVENWEEVAALGLARLRAEIAYFGSDTALEAFADRLARHPRLRCVRPLADDRMIIPMRIRAGGDRLALFTTIAQFGSAQEIALSEVKIELMFPADAATEAWFSR